MIKGDRVTLVPVNDITMALIVKWHEDPWFDDVLSNECSPKSANDLRNFYAQFLPPAGRIFAATIVPLDGMDEKDKEKLDNKQKDMLAQPMQIGIIALTNIDMKNRKAEIFGGIGEPTLREKGYGIEGLGLMVKWARKELGLHRIYAYIKEHNQLAINSMKSAGFVLECMMKDATYQDGQFINKALMSSVPKELKDKNGNIYYAS